MGRERRPLRDLKLLIKQSRKCHSTKMAHDETQDLDEDKKNISQKQLIKFRKKMNHWQKNELLALIDMQENAVDAVKLEWLMKDRKMKIREDGEISCHFLSKLFSEIFRAFNNSYFSFRRD